MAFQRYSFVKPGLSLAGGGDESILAISVPSTIPPVAFLGGKLFFLGVVSGDKPITAELIIPGAGGGGYSGTVESNAIRPKLGTSVYTPKTVFRVAPNYTPATRDATDEWVGAWAVHPQTGLMDPLSDFEIPLLESNKSYELVLNNGGGNAVDFILWLEFEE